MLIHFQELEVKIVSKYQERYNDATTDQDQLRVLIKMREELEELKAAREATINPQP